MTLPEAMKVFVDQVVADGERTEAEAWGLVCQVAASFYAAAVDRERGAA